MERSTLRMGLSISRDEVIAPSRRAPRSRQVSGMSRRRQHAVAPGRGADAVARKHRGISPLRRSGRLDAIAQTTAAAAPAVAGAAAACERIDQLPTVKVVPFDETRPAGVSSENARDWHDSDAPMSVGLLGIANDTLPVAPATGNVTDTRFA